MFLFGLVSRKPSVLVCHCTEYAGMPEYATPNSWKTRRISALDVDHDHRMEAFFLWQTCNLRCRTVMGSGMLLRIWPRKSEEMKLHIPMRILKTIGFLRLRGFCSLVINNFSGYNDVLMERTLI